MPSEIGTHSGWPAVVNTGEGEILNSEVNLEVVQPSRRVSFCIVLATLLLMWIAAEWWVHLYARARASHCANALNESQ